MCPSIFLNYSEVKNIDVNARHKYGKTAFMLACYKGQIDVVKLLLDHSEDKNIDLNATTYSLGRTAFMIACGEGHKAVVKLLLDYSKDKNIDLNAKTNYGGTVFHLAFKHKGVRQLLLDHHSVHTPLVQ